MSLNRAGKCLGLAGIAAGNGDPRPCERKRPGDRFSDASVPARQEHGLSLEVEETGKLRSEVDRRRDALHGRLPANRSAGRH